MSITAADIRQRAAEAAHDHTCILRADQVDAIAAIEDAARATALAEVARLHVEYHGNPCRFNWCWFQWAVVEGNRAAPEAQP